MHGPAQTIATTPCAVVEVFGDDRFEFLQGQFSNDLRGHGPWVRYGLWLDRKGKVVADSQVLFTGDDRVLLLSDFSPARTILDRLEPFVIADDVTFEDRTGVWACRTVFGPGAGAVLTQLGWPDPPPGELAEAAGGWCFRGRRTGDGVSFLYSLSGGAGEDWWRRAVDEGLLLEAGEEDVIRARWAAGVPAVPLEIGPGDLPQEGGLVPAAVSLTKGCYQGQEVMARLHSLGRERRGLYHVAADWIPKDLPLKLEADGREAGWWRSALAGEGGAEGVALLRHDAVRAHPRLEASGGLVAVRGRFGAREEVS
ncbi:MAG: folate-binding protein [Puniceicoccaceae bacterium]|nr:MAG: folate-binding protein [Puniceicoccaceae bacterium]